MMVAWEPNHISREDLVAKILELAVNAGYEDPDLSTRLIDERGESDYPYQQFLNLYNEIRVEFRLWSPGEAFDSEKSAPFRLSSEEIKSLCVIGDFIDPLGKYIHKSHEAHLAWEAQALRRRHVMRENDMNDDGGTHPANERHEEQTKAFEPDPAQVEQPVQAIQPMPNLGSLADRGRAALAFTLIEEYGFEAGLAAKVALAAHPLDDNPVPSRTFEKQVRKTSRRFGKALRKLRGKPEEAESLTRETLKAYKNLAAQHGEGHYINRYNKAIGPNGSE